jgi:hypothetical protein
VGSMYSKKGPQNTRLGTVGKGGGIVLVPVQKGAATDVLLCVCSS